LINDEAFRVAFDKAETSTVAKSLGIKTPREFSFNRDEIREVSRDAEVSNLDGYQLRFPIYLKPRSSITQTDVKNKRTAQRIETAAELAEKLRNDCPSDGLLMQESFAGVGIGVEVLASDGKVLMQLQHQRLRETIDGGSTYRETIAEIPELTEATAKLVARLNYTGVAMFEYRYCPKTQDWVFLEINARFWGSLPLAIASGANFPFGLYELLVNDRRDFSSSYVVGRRCRNLVTDFRAFRKQKGSKLHLRRFLLGKDHLDFFATDDWRPQLTNLGELAGSLLRKLFQRRQTAS
jgi:predicted ATP-grasp superfamily ATP-dependent carboligase